MVPYFFAFIVDYSFVPLHMCLLIVIAYFAHEEWKIIKKIPYFGTFYKKYFS